MICIAASTEILKRFILILPILPRKLKTELTFDNIYLYCIRASTACEKYIQRKGGREAGRQEEKGGERKRGQTGKERERESVCKSMSSEENTESLRAPCMCVYIYRYV